MQLDYGVSYIQISYPISQGSSGGAIFNLKDEVITYFYV
jgi:S1-C subfamily serine protease